MLKNALFGVGLVLCGIFCEEYIISMENIFFSFINK